MASVCCLPDSIGQRLVTDLVTVLPDISKQDNVDLLQRWDGPWAFLSSLSWVRISKTGTVKPSSFPPSSQ